jgi:alanyl-tRNA synthetase
MNQDLYITGLTSNGQSLMGGIWRHYHQNGFPLEITNLVAKENGWCVDWLEAMADASIDNNLPSLMSHLETFLDEETLVSIKISFMNLLNKGRTFSSILEDKKKNAKILEELLTTSRSVLK